MFFYFLIIVLIVALGMFLPKWLYWISPRAYSAYDVFREQYGSRMAMLIIILIAVLIGGCYSLLQYGSHHGW